jgi:hypothetical protein
MFVVAVALCAGYLAGKSSVRVTLYSLAGVAAIVVTFVSAVVVPSPEGDGWAGRVLVFGHWVPEWQANLEAWSLLAWLVGIWVMRRLFYPRLASVLSPRS